MFAGICLIAVPFVAWWLKILVSVVRVILFLFSKTDLGVHRAG
jgi:hypothetical protein